MFPPGPGALTAKSIWPLGHAAFVMQVIFWSLYVSPRRELTYKSLNHKLGEERDAVLSPLIPIDHLVFLLKTLSHAS